MTKEEFAALESGDLIRNIGSKRSYVVTHNYGGHVTAVNSVDMSNPDEWELVQLYCHECSIVADSGQPIFHLPPICHTRDVNNEK